ncbi:MAG: hypothetical protein ACI4TA_03035 [Acetatifactor sp.]
MNYQQNNPENQQNDNQENNWENARDNWKAWEEQQEKKDWDHWDSNASHSSYYNQPVHTPYDQGFAKASLVMGFLATIFSCWGLSLPFGSLGILFAMLCKRKGRKLNSNCRTGLVLSVIGIVSGLLLIIYCVYMMMNSPEFMNQLNAITQSLYGMDFNEMLQQR